ncbi:MAG: TonB-dependent receptor plug domain-containing protein [Cyclobacteriaceae bacterium]
MMKANKGICLALTFLIVLSANAQKVIYGKITAFDSQPVAKAEIIVRKTKKTALSNSLGEFSIECRENDKLSIRANGFKSKLIKVKNVADSIDVNLLFGGTQKDFENAVESGHMERDEMVLAVTKFEAEAEEIENFDYESVPRMIEIKFPRVTLVDDVFVIRGKASINANTAVLIFVNGVPSNMNAIMNMSVDEVGSIRVLMGGETTQYGGGGNGVILITTRIE